MSALVVYRKELLDTLRDRRTLAAMILVPMVVYPATLLVTTETVVAEERAARDRVLELGVAPALPEDLERFLEGEDRLVVTKLGDSPFDAAAARGALKDGLHAVLVLTPTAAHALGADGTAEARLYVDATQPAGRAPEARVKDALRRYAATKRDARLVARGLPPSLADPLEVKVRSVATEHERGNHLLGLILPSLVLLFVALSSLYPAIDLTAGEKERRTLATLLTTPVPLPSLVLGKLLAVVTVGTLAGLLNVAALGLTFLRVLHSTEPGGAAAALSFSVDAGTALGLLGAVLAAAFPLGAMMLLFASFARSFRDANLLLSPVLLLAMVPAAVVMLPGATIDSGFSLVPVANAALWMKALLSGPVPGERVLLVLLSSAGLTTVLAAGVVRAFQDERALFSTEGRRADFARLLFAPPRPGLGSALAFVAIGFAVTFFVGLVVGPRPIPTVLATQVFGYLAPSLALALWMRPQLAPHALLASSSPRPLALLAGALLGLSGWMGVSLPMGWLTELVIPGQAEAAADFSAALDLNAQPLWVLLLTAAALPALAEELAFRGVVFRLLGSGRGALWGQAVLFGLVHGSLYRFLPTFGLGLALGAIRARTGSVWPGVIAHAMTNAILISAERLLEPSQLEALGSPSPWALLGLLGVAAAFAAGARSASRSPDSAVEPG